jgi:hypothetical protein
VPARRLKRKLQSLRRLLDALHLPYGISKHSIGRLSFHDLI